eukprot:1262597-Alexandrium_andersonii.AAC.1
MAGQGQRFADSLKQALDTDGIIKGGTAIDMRFRRSLSKAEAAQYKSLNRNTDRRAFKVEWLKKVP